MLIKNSMIDLSEEDKDWNIATTAKVCRAPHTFDLKLTVTSISNVPLL
jgi:fructose/tagatose bisphosphate aldolase